MSVFIYSSYRLAADLSFLELGQVDVLDVSHNHSSNVTEFPIQSGSTITDHIQILPERLQITGLVGNVMRRNFKAPDIQQAWDVIRRYRHTGELITLTTDVQLYTDMIIKSLSTRREIKDGPSLRFTMELQKIRLVGVERVEFPDVDRPYLVDPGQDRGDDADQGDIGSRFEEYPPPPPTGGGSGGGIGSYDYDAPVYSRAGGQTG